jgi:hypothetical protein
VAIQEFIIGPQNYFEEGYFSGDYTESNVSRAFLECDIDNIKGGRVVTGEYYLDNYIDGTYYHNNSMGFTMAVDAMIVQEATVSLQSYYTEGYYATGYYESRGSQFVLTAELESVGQTVEAIGSWSSQFDIVGQSSRTLQTSASLTLEFTQTVIGSRSKDIDLFAFSEAAIAVEISVLRNSNISVTAVFDIATDGRRFRDLSSAEDSQFDFAVVNGRSREFNIETQAAFSFESSADRSRLTQIQLTAFASQLTLGILPVLAIGSFTATTAVSANARKFTGIISNITATASLQAVPTVIPSDWNIKTWMAGIKATNDTRTEFSNLNYTNPPSQMTVDESTDSIYELHDWYDFNLAQASFVLAKRSARSGNLIYTKIGLSSLGSTISNIVYDSGKVYFAISDQPSSSQYRTAIYVYNESTDQISTIRSRIDRITRIDINNGEIYIGGLIFSSPYAYATIEKFSSAGTRLWSRRRATNSFNTTYECSSFSFDNEAVYATFTNSNSELTDIVKVDKSTGNLIQAKNIQDFRGGTMKRDSAGNFYLVSRSAGQFTNGLQAIAAGIIKFDSNLNVISSKKFSRTTEKRIIDLDVDSDGSVVILDKNYVYKLNNSFDSVWSTGFTYETYTSPNPRIGLFSNIHLTGDSVYFIGNITAAQPHLSISVRVEKDFGEPYFDNIPFREGVLVSRSSNSYDEGSWSYQTQDQLEITTGSFNITTYTDFNWSLTGTGDRLSTGITFSNQGSTLANYRYVNGVFATGNWNASVTTSINAGKFHGTSVNLVATSSITVSAITLRQISAQPIARLTTAITARKIARVNSQSLITSTTVVNGQRVRYYSAGLQAQTNLTADAVKQIGVVAQSSTISTAEITAEKITDITTDFEAIAINLAAAVKNATGTVLLESTSSLEIDAIKITDEPNNFASTTELNGLVQAIRDNSSELSSEFVLDIQSDRLKAGLTDINVEASLTANTEISKTTGISAVVVSVSNLTASTERSRDNIILQASLGTLTCDNQVLRLAAASLDIFTEIIASPTFIVRITAEFTAFNTQLTVGEVLNLDPALTYVIPQETREFQILPETRLYYIASESRELIILKG